MIRNSIEAQSVEGVPVIWKVCRIRKILRQVDEIRIQFVRTGREQILNKNGSYKEGKYVKKEQTAVLEKLPNGRYQIKSIGNNP